MPVPLSRRVRSADGTCWLAAHDHGGAGAPCLLLHGNGLHARAYDALVARLTAGGLRVIAVDHRGMGASTLPAGASGNARTGAAAPAQQQCAHPLLRRSVQPARTCCGRASARMH